MKLIDMHCHAFPDAISSHAMNILTGNCDYIPETDGTLSDTIKIQNSWGCYQFVLLDIATSVSSVSKVNDFLIEKNDNKRIFSFGTIYPGFNDYINELDKLERNHIKGIKFHPCYQNFKMSDKSLYPLYEEIAKRNMIMLFHCGYEPAFPSYNNYCSPKIASQMVNDFHGAKIILAHMGDCLDTNDTIRYLAGQDIFFDVSMAYFHMGKEKMERLIKYHGVEKFLYASDCPWSSGTNTQKIINSMNIVNSDKEKIFYKNAAKLLQINERDII